MKTKLIVTAAVIFLFTVTASAANFYSQRNLQTINNAAIENLMAGVKSDNYGLKTSSAYFLGEYQSAKAVIPLMAMLHNEKNEDARIVAALALYKIGNPVGIYAVKQACRFDESERVRKMCTNFYNNFVRDHLSLKNVALK